MKAIVYEKYGPPEVLQLRDVPKPVPRDHEVLVRNRATTVSTGDWRVRSLELPRGFGVLGRLVLGISKPRQPILGTELAGVVEAVGKSVTRFRVGDAVFAFPGGRMGCYADYRCISEAGAIALKPVNLSFEEAAALSFGGSTALDFLRKGAVCSGERVLINGASGSVGTAAVQLARHLGAHVTGVCSGANAELVRSLGAEHVIDYTQEDFTRRGQKYDVIIDIAGTCPYERSARALADGGRLLLVLNGLKDLFTAPWISMRGRHKVIAGPASETADNLRQLGELAAAGTFKPVIDRQYTLDQMVAAHHYVDQGHKRGNVVIRWETSDRASPLSE